MESDPVATAPGTDLRPSPNPLPEEEGKPGDKETPLRVAISRRGARVGREMLVSERKVSRALTLSTTNQRCRSHGELQWPKADVHNFDQVRAVLSYRCVKHCDSVHGVHGLECQARRIHQHQLVRHIRRRFGDDGNFLSASRHCQSCRRCLAGGRAARLIARCAGPGCWLTADCRVLQTEAIDVNNSRQISTLEFVSARGDSAELHVVLRPELRSL